MRREATKPDINVTPLVDVVLVLLIIFMVIAPQMQDGPAIELPGVLHPDPKVRLNQEPVEVQIDSKGGLYFEKEALGRDDLLERLRGVHRAEPDRRVALRADRAARYGDVRNLFRQAREIGFPGVALQVGERREKSED